MISSLQLQCDEYVQKTERDQTLFRKIDQVKKERGEYAISGKGFTLVQRVKVMGCYNCPLYILCVIFSSCLRVKHTQRYH